MSEAARSRPIVICGSLRAGTTLLRLLLGQHSCIEGFGESDLLVDRLPSAQNRDDPDALAAYKSHALNSRLARKHGFSALEGKTREEVFAELLARHPLSRQHLLLTLHRHFDRAAEMMPDAFFIRLQRDPRDCALSAVQMGWGGLPYHALGPWIAAEKDWEVAKAMIPADRQVFLRYEDLVADPTGELTRVLGAAGLSFEEAVLTPTGSTYSSPRPREAEAFRKKLSEREIAEINSRLDFVVDDYGYNLEPKVPPGRLRRSAMRLAAKRNVLSHRVGRYGAGLVLKEIVSRKLGLQAMHKDTRERIEAIAVTYLK
jgi:hypothetical protein